MRCISYLKKIVFEKKSTYNFVNVQEKNGQETA